jgi:hypothetical protein
VLWPSAEACAENRAVPTVFLNHAGEDAERARRIADLLRDEQIAVWLDVERLRPGDRWMERSRPPEPVPRSLQGRHRRSRFECLGARGARLRVDRGYAAPPTLATGILDTHPLSREEEGARLFLSGFRFAGVALGFVAGFLAFVFADVLVFVRLN